MRIQIPGYHSTSQTLARCFISCSQRPASISLSHCLGHRHSTPRLSIRSPNPRQPHFTMAWRCSGETNTALIENMSRSRLIKDDRVKAAFLKVRFLSIVLSLNVKLTTAYIGRSRSLRPREPLRGLPSDNRPRRYNLSTSYACLSNRAHDLTSRPHAYVSLTAHPRRWLRHRVPHAYPRRTGWREESRRWA